MNESQDFQGKIQYFRNYNGDAADGERPKKKSDDLTIYRSFNCPRCRTSISVSKDDVGKSVACPDCDTNLVVPDYLDFSPTDEEIRRAARLTAEKQRRDELMSPIKNPNRTGVELQSDDVYGIVENGAENRFLNRELFPVHCSVCKTLMYASRGQLGLPICCPDCGAKTIATSAVRRQIEAEEAKSVVPVPEKGASEPLKIVEPEPVSETKSKRGKLALLLQNKSLVWDPGVHPDKNLPLVLRRRGDSVVWALGSPPENSPLFTRTFRTLAMPELWFRAGALAALLAAVSAIQLVFFVLFDNVLATEALLLAIAWAAFNAISLYAFSYWAAFFTAIFSAGNLGARRVRDWLDEEDLWGKIGYGILFWSVATLAAGPGFLVATATTNASGGEVLDVLFASADSNVVSWAGAIGPAAGFCVFFPIFFLSTLQTNWLFAPICRPIVESWARRPLIWAQFYWASLFFVGVPIALFIRHIGRLDAWLAAPFVAPLATIFYALLLGRLSWILDDDIRRDEAEAEGWEY